MLAFIWISVLLTLCFVQGLQIFISTLHKSHLFLVRGGVNCDFESGLCSWQNKGEAEWVTTRGFNGYPPDTGPNIDHTTDSTVGHFLQADSADQVPGTSPFLLESSEFQAVTKFCFTFFYYMHGDNLGSLILSVRTILSTIIKTFMLQVTEVGECSAPIYPHTSQTLLDLRQCYQSLHN